MLITEYDRDMDIAVNRREAWEDGLAEGRAEGRAEGEAKEKNEIAQKMKLMGFSDEQIRTATGI